MIEADAALTDDERIERSRQLQERHESPRAVQKKQRVTKYWSKTRSALQALGQDREWGELQEEKIAGQQRTGADARVFIFEHCAVSIYHSQDHVLARSDGAFTVASDQTTTSKEI